MRRFFCPPTTYPLVAHSVHSKVDTAFKRLLAARKGATQVRVDSFFTKKQPAAVVDKKSMTPKKGTPNGKAKKDVGTTTGKKRTSTLSPASTKPTKKLHTAIFYGITMCFSSLWMYVSVYKHSPPYTPSATTSFSRQHMLRCIVHFDRTRPGTCLHFDTLPRKCIRKSYNRFQSNNSDASYILCSNNKTGLSDFLFKKDHQLCNDGIIVTDMCPHHNSDLSIDI